MNDLAFRCDQIRAGSLFRNLDWSILSKQVTVLMGSSGSGKSTLLRILAGLSTPDAGSVWRKDQNLGMVFQRNALFDSMTSLENLEFTLKENLLTKRDFSAKRARALALEMLDRVGLTKAADLYPHSLSGGMQKRLGIARALIARPDTILYDDPTAGLDPITSREITRVILDFQWKMQSTVVVVTNERARALQMSDEIFILTYHGISSSRRDPSANAWTRGEFL